MAVNGGYLSKKYAYMPNSTLEGLQGFLQIGISIINREVNPMNPDSKAPPTPKLSKPLPVVDFAVLENNILNQQAENLFNLRKLLGWSREQMSERICCKSRTYEKYENRKNPMPVPLDIIGRISIVTGVSTHFAAEKTCYHSIAGKFSHPALFEIQAYIGYLDEIQFCGACRCTGQVAGSQQAQLRKYLLPVQTPF